MKKLIVHAIRRQKHTRDWQYKFNWIQSWSLTITFIVLYLKVHTIYDHPLQGVLHASCVTIIGHLRNWSKPLQCQMTICTTISCISVQSIYILMLLHIHAGRTMQEWSYQMMITTKLWNYVLQYTYQCHQFNILHFFFVSCVLIINKCFEFVPSSGPPAFLCILS